MSTTTRVSLRRNDDHSNSILRRTPPTMVARAPPPPPRNIVTLSGFSLPTSSTFGYETELDLSPLPPPPPPFRGVGNGVVTLSGYLHPSSFDHGGTDIDPFNYLLPSHLCDNNSGKKAGKKEWSSSREGDEGGYSVKQDKGGVQFMVDMPGVSKEDTKVYLDGATLVMEGHRKLDLDDDEDQADNKKTKSKTKSYEAEVDLVPMHIHNVGDIKAELKNGVLRVTVPKVKDEERTDLIHFPVLD